MPIIHVNADDPEAAIAAVRLALAFRRRFGHDVVVDLVGYRRFGHNEQDEPAYTQPLMAERIAEHPPVREQFAERLVAEGVVTRRGGRAARRGGAGAPARGARALEGVLRRRRMPAKPRDESIAGRDRTRRSRRRFRPSACAS